MNAPYDVIRSELDSARNAIRRDTEPFYAAHFAAGSYEIEGKYTAGEPYSVNSKIDLLCERRFLPTGDVAIVVLPEADFPHTYDLFYRAQWLMQKEQSMQPR